MTNIIGLSGYAQSGKDTVANYLVNNYGFTKISFADPIRKALYLLNPKVRVADMSGVSLAAAVDGLGWENLKAESTDARELLQRMGTEVGREMFGKDFWVNQAIIKAREHEKVVFADVRYENEVQAILEASGAVWRVSKPEIQAVNRHESETSLDSYSFHKHIYNSGSLEDLYGMVEDLVNDYDHLLTK
jgi:dephospho-CoA kinase